MSRRLTLVAIVSSLVLLGALSLQAFVLVPQANAKPQLPALRPADPDALRRARLELVARSTGQPVAFAAPAGAATGEGWLVEKSGRLRTVAAAGLGNRPILDLSAEVSGGGEQGLLGLAFHPHFMSDGRFYTNHTDKAGDSVVTAWRVARPTTWAGGVEGRPLPQVRREARLLRVHQPFSNHNGGHLAFGPDGRLYVGFGDGGAAFDPLGHAQNPTSLLGKLVALDVEVPDPRPVLVASGLRNPWSFTFDRVTGDCWIADVGQNRWEEVNHVTFATLAGRNFGWSRVEGRGHCVGPRSACEDPAFTAPVWEYAHERGCSVTGGVAYRGRLVPWLRGRYLFSDYCTAFVHVLRMEAGQVVEAEDASPWFKAVEATRITALAEDAAGEVIVLGQDGGVWRLVPAARPRKGATLQRTDGMRVGS